MPLDRLCAIHCRSQRAPRDNPPEAGAGAVRARPMPVCVHFDIRESAVLERAHVPIGCYQVRIFYGIAENIRGK